MRIDKLSLTNFRCFDDREFDLKSQFNLIVGDNATGKTAVLEAVAIGLSRVLRNFPPPAKHSRGIAERDVRQKLYLHGTSLTVEPQYPCRIALGAELYDHGQTDWEVGNTGGETMMHSQALDSLTTTWDKEIRSGSDRPLPAISYYGAERLWVQLPSSEVQTAGPLSRFAGYRDCLNPASNEKALLAWFKTQEFIALQRKEEVPVLEACREAIRGCVPGSTRVYFDVSYDQLVLEIDGQGVPFSFLSDGFRSMLALVADLAVRCAMINPQFTSSAALSTAGVVLIDELDLHLHPKWQRRVITDLMRTFPKIQFIATTHSPFVIQSLPPTDAVRLINLDDESNHDVRDKSIEDIAEWVQGVELPQRSQRYLDMKQKAEEYFAMLRGAKAASDTEKEAARAELEQLAIPFGDSPAYHAFLKMQELAARGDRENRGMRGGTP